MSALHKAHVAVLRNLLDDLTAMEDIDDHHPPCTSMAYLRDFCLRAIHGAPDMPIDKLARWTGFIQGVMAARGLLSVEAERNRTRGIFGEARDDV